MNQRITARRDTRIPVLVVSIWIAVLVCATSAALKDERAGVPETVGALVVEGGQLLLTGEPSPGSAVVEPHHAALVYGKVPVNRAGMAVLQTVPGIGPELARRIVAERQRGGIFDGADQLTRVSGIGSVRARQFQEFLLFD